MADVQKIYTGDSFGISVTLYLNGSLYSLNSSATVTCGLRDSNANLLAGPWTIVRTDTGNDWTNGVVVVPVAGADTQALSEQSGVQVEIQYVYGSTKLTWVGGNLEILEDAI